MELEDMQAAWSEMSSALDKQKQLTDEIILKMTQERHTSRWNSYRRFEFIGAIVCYAAVIYLLFNFTKLDTLGLQICGGLMIVFLIALPIFSLGILKNMANLTIDSRDNAQMMKAYAKKKKNFVTFQKVNIGASLLFMFLTIPVSSKILNDENLLAKFDEKLLFALPLCVLFFALLMWWVTKVNRKMLHNTETLLSEVQEMS